MTRFAYVAPPSNGLELAMRDARHRRFRSASYSTSLTAAVGVVLFVALGGAPTSSLTQQPAPVAPAVPPSISDTQGSHHAPAVPNTVAPGQITALGGAGGTTSGSPLVTKPGSGQVLSPTSTSPFNRGDATHVEKPGTSMPSYKAGAIQRFDNQPNTDVNCVVSKAQSLCSYPYTNVSTNGTVLLSAYICTGKVANSPLYFPNAQEVDFTITNKAGKEVWRWSRWHPTSEHPHTLVLSTAGTCFDWDFTWTQVDFTGKRVPIGDYHLTITYRTADAPNAQDVTDFTIR